MSAVRVVRSCVLFAVLILVPTVAFCGIRERLNPLTSSMTPHALMPDPRLAEWVRQSVVR